MNGATLPFILLQIVLFSSFFNKLDNLTLMEINTTGAFLTQALDHMYKLRSNLQLGERVESQEFWPQGIFMRRVIPLSLHFSGVPGFRAKLCCGRLRCNVLRSIWLWGNKWSAERSSARYPSQPASVAGEEDLWLSFASTLLPNTLPSAARPPFQDDSV